MKLIHATFLCAALGVTVSAAQAETYKFNVNNKTDSKITELLVSEDGKKWAPFDLGGGVAAGESATMAWNESTNDQNCEQHVKAVYEDKSESEAESFDFCEDDLELDFE